MKPFEPEDEDGKFFDYPPRAWTKSKLDLLAYYLPFWVKKRGSTKPKLAYVDGFAGRGSFGLGPERVDGSPLIAARKANELRVDGAKYELHCHNVELCAPRSRNLERNLRFADNPNVTVHCGSFEDKIGEILPAIQGMPSLFFLDPFGIVGVAPDEIAPVVKRHDTEILMTLNIPTMQRLTGSRYSFAPEAQGKVNRLNRVLGELPGAKEPVWAMKLDMMDAKEWATWAARHYLDLLRILNPKLMYGDCYPVRETDDSRTHYFLVFASRRKDAFPVLSQKICEIEEQVSNRTEKRRAGAPVNQIGMFESAHTANRRDSFAAIKEAILKYGLDNQGSSIRDLQEEFCMRHLGRLLPSEVRHLVKSLETDGHAKVEEVPRGIDRDLRPVRFQ